MQFLLFEHSETQDLATARIVIGSILLAMVLATQLIAGL